MIQISNFYCEVCGTKGIPIPRNKGKQRESFHKKKLYCLNCKMETNHIECKNEIEEKIFIKEWGELKSE